MNKKGLTLAEMLVVISILALITLSIFPNITGMIKKIDNEKYQRFLSDFFLASEAYIQANISEYSNIKEKNKKVYIYFEDLVNSGYLKSTVYDNKNKEIVKNEDFTVEVYLNDDNEYSYKIYEEHLKPGPLYVTPLSDETHKGTIYLDPTNLNNTCNEENSVSDVGTKTGCMKWYVYDDGGDTYKLLLDHNTTIDTDWNLLELFTDDDSELWATLDRDTTEWDSSINAFLLSANEIARLSGDTVFDSATTGYCDWDNQPDFKNWLNVNLNAGEGYWTPDRTVDFVEAAWSVSRGGLSWDSASMRYNSIGIRPAIEISKDIIKI